MEGFGRITLPLKFVPSASGGNTITASAKENPAT